MLVKLIGTALGRGWGRGPREQLGGQGWRPLLWWVPDGSQQPRVTLLHSPSPWALQAGVSCPSLRGQALHLWTLELQGGSTCRDGALVSTGFERFPKP